MDVPVSAEVRCADGLCGRISCVIIHPATQRVTHLVVQEKGFSHREYLVPIDEVAYYSATVGTSIQQKEFNACNRDITARGRAPGIIPVEATQRPSADILPTSLRDLFGYRWAFRCSTEASSDTILGHGWADKGYSATEIDPQARGVSWLRAEDGIPRRIKAAYLTDEQIIHLASHAATARTKADHGDGKVINMRRKGDAA